MQEWNHNYAEVNGLNIHYVKEGSGKTLVIMLHGWPEFWFSWRHQLVALKEKYTVVAPDMRGFNLSDKPKDLKDYKQNEVAKDIVALVKHLGFEKAVMVGHDWGGAIAWNLALNHPEVVEKFIVMNCPHPGVFIKNLKANPFQLFKSIYMFAFKIPVLPEILMGLNIKKFFEQIFRGWALNKENFPDEEIEKYVDAFNLDGAKTGGFNYYRANTSFDAIKTNAFTKGRKVKADTLMIWAEGDIVLGKELIEGTAKYIEGDFKIHRIPECSHWVQNDCPEEVNKAILDFLD